MVSPASTIDVSGPAQPGTVGLLRAVAATLAARLGMDVEAIEELRMAVDEASSLHGGEAAGPLGTGVQGLAQLRGEPVAGAAELVGGHLE